MPELPEAEVMCRQLRKLLVDKKIVGGKVFHRSFATVRGGGWLPPLPAGTVEQVWRHGKWIMFEVRAADRVEVVRANMGMSGRFFACPLGKLPPVVKKRHVRWTARYTDGETTMRLLYIDPRCMGRLYRLTREQKEEALSRMLGSAGAPSMKLGPDALSLLFTRAHTWRARGVLAERLRKPRGIKRLLMEQSRVAGLGNIYAAEACWHMQVHPDFPGDALSTVHLNRYLKRVPAMLAASVKAGGTSFGDANSYRDARGVEGGNSSNLHVYGREGQPCHRCRTPILKTRRGGRSTYHCPKCQRIT
jgi:formamidopyrimidine-DNA glycosylase